MNIESLNTVNELIEENKKSTVDVALDAMNDLTPSELHEVTMVSLNYLKKMYGEFYKETEDNQFLWDGCKIGTCVQVFSSLVVMEKILKKGEE